MKKFLPFALPDIGEDEITEVVDSLKSGWLTTGPKTKQFEQDFANLFGSEVEAIAVNSATAGLHLALEALGVGEDDEVITTPYTFTSTAEVIRYLGAHPVFVDIDERTLNMDVHKLEQAITEKTKVIIPVHVAGLACDMEPILQIANKYNLKVMEDAAHAFPTKYQGKLVGQLETDVTVYSFYATKTITTGEGGMILTRNPEIAKRCRTMRLHGINRDVFDRYTSTKPKWYYEVVEPGFKYNLTDLASSIGIHQLRKVYQFQAKRQSIATQYDEAFQDLPLILPAHAACGDMHSWHLYVIRLQNDVTITRDCFIEKMAALGIGCSVHFIPLHIHPYWSKAYDLKPEDFPEAFKAYERALSLPIYTKMTDADVTRVIEAVRSILIQ